MTIGWSLLTLLGLAFALLAAWLLVRLGTSSRDIARPPKKLREADPDPTVAHLGHS